MRRLTGGAVQTAIFLSTSVLALFLTAAVAAADVVMVGPGQSIQAAIDAAPPGSTIQVQPGVYNENLVVAKDGITLQGAGPGSTLLRPPPSPRNTPCDPVEGTGRASGVCIVGDVDFASSHVLRHIQNPRVTGFDIQNFSSFGILIVGAEGVRVEGNVLSNNGAYGVFAIDSTGIQFLNNTTNRNVQAGMYIGSSPQARAVVSGNVSNDNNGDGILLGVSNFGSVSNNTFSGNCAGIRLVGNPGVGTNWSLSGNAISANNRACPARSGVGILIIAGQNIAVQGNTVTGHVPSGPSPASGGIAVISRGTVAPANVLVRGNTVLNNSPADLVWDGTGTGIFFTANRCATSIPPGLCAA